MRKLSISIVAFSVFTASFLSGSAEASPVLLLQGSAVVQEKVDDVKKKAKQAASKAQDKTQRKRHDTNVIVTSDWLTKELDKKSGDIRILDLALRKTNYKTGHIPGAVFVDWRNEIVDDKDPQLYSLPSQDRMEKLMSKLGISNNTMVILADNTKNRMSVRMFFTMKYFGHKNVRILDGGTTAWAKSGKKMTGDIPEIKTAQYKIGKMDKSFVVSLQAVEKAIKKDVALVDGRPVQHFSGEAFGRTFHQNKPHKKKGHIPGAINIPWESNMNADSTFKSLDELRELYEKHGIDTDSEVVAYCNEGLHAAMPWFILTQLLGNSQTTVYDNSMAEWANMDNQPMEMGTSK